MDSISALITVAGAIGKGMARMQKRKRARMEFYLLDPCVTSEKKVQQCSQCGAPLVGSRCSYCGSRFAV